MLTPMKSELGKSSTDLNTDTWRYPCRTLWSPNPPVAGSEATLALNFNDALSDSSLKADVNYEISVKNSANGKEIIKKDNLIAINGTGTQKITFPDSGTYQIEINVKSIKYRWSNNR